MLYEIINKIEEVPNVYRIEIYEPDIAKKAKPGQFIILMSDEVSERIPISIADTSDETITVFVQEQGISSAKIANMQAGEVFYSVVGPLGLPAVIDNFGTVLLGGGCYGIGGIYPLAKALKKAGNKIITILEARSSYLLYFEEELKTISDELFVATSDGTKGFTGQVHDVVDILVNERNYKFDHAKFIGCTFMMMNCSNATLPYKIPTMVALNAIMLDGTGMCGCCRVSVGGETKFACVDGPEFDGHVVDWDLMMKRKGSYLQEEMMAYQKDPHVCKALEQLYLEGECDD